jgi:hypothetical protein
MTLRIFSCSPFRLWPSPRPGTSILLCTAFIFCGCDGKKPTGSAEVKPSAGEVQGASSGGTSGAPADKPGAKEAAKIVSALPPADKVLAVVNSGDAKPYAGPTGSVRGIVTATGDKAPDLAEVLAKMDANCDVSRQMFGKLFREGEKRELADVLVAVTEYKGYVPADGVDVPVWGKGCAWESRTIAITYGQRLSIAGVDNRPYVPEILGQPMPAQLFALPTAPPVQLPPQRPGRFKLVDSMRLYNVAELFVLPYRTVAVTRADGQFLIKGIPVGKAKINALLPQTGAVSGQEITIEAGKVTEVNFELTFDAAAYEKLPKDTPLDELPAPKMRAPL